MPKIVQLPTHIANLIAAGEVVERPASVVKELVENAIDAGASKLTVEIREGGMTFLRVTDNGCGMSREDAHTAFLRHATSKLRCAEDLMAIDTMGFRGEALAAIASVSRVDLLTKTAGAIEGTSLHLEAGVITEEAEAGCPEGTTILVRDLFFNTPARMKFMRSDTVEGSKVTSAMQLQALAHPEVAIRLLRDGKEVLSTPGDGKLGSAAYSIYGKDCAKMVEVSSRWDVYSLRGFVSKPTDARPSRSMQTFFVNGRPVKSQLLVSALEEAYRNQIMVGRFPACVLHLTLPANAVDVNVHPAKTEVKFLSEKTVFDCIHYGVQGTLNKTADRPQVSFPTSVEQPQTKTASVQKTPSAGKQGSFFRTMDAKTYQEFARAMEHGPKPKPDAAQAAFHAMNHTQPVVGQPIRLPEISTSPTVTLSKPKPEIQQTELPMPPATPWRMVGELYRSYILVEQGEEAFLIDKHAAHERILFDKLKANPERVSSQTLLTPLPCHLQPDAAAELLANGALMEQLGFEIEEFGGNTLLLRQIPMDLNQEDGADLLEALAADLLSGKRDDPNDLRDELLHTVACKAAIKAGWNTDQKELEVLVEQVMGREDLKYCPHGRPICITLSRRQLEKQFKRT